MATQALTTPITFCESAWAGSHTPLHVRLADGGIKLGGGVGLVAFCGRDVAWDVATPTEDLERLTVAPSAYVCEPCRLALLSL